MAASVQVIEAHLQDRGIKKDKDVEELYLAKQNLSECVELTRFKYLRCLWLNKNKLREITCVDNNFQLAELYLQNNQLTDISGALQHLTSLKVLMLHNNQLTKLDKVVKEFNKMQCLKTLNLFNNPVAQEPDYRLFVIHSVSSVALLDRQVITEDMCTYELHVQMKKARITKRMSSHIKSADSQYTSTTLTLSLLKAIIIALPNSLEPDQMPKVLKGEKEAAKKIYDQEQEKIRETVAFGRRSEGPPSLYYPGKEQQLTKFDTRDLGNSFLRDSPLYVSEEDACNARRLKKSVTLYTTFDWSKIPRIEERRQTDAVFDSPEIITHVYR